MPTTTAPGTTPKPTTTPKATKPAATKTTVVPLASTGTGSDTTLAFTGGLALLVIGTGLALVSRRRRGDHR